MIGPDGKRYMLPLPQMGKPTKKVAEIVDQPYLGGGSHLSTPKDKVCPVFLIYWSHALALIAGPSLMRKSGEDPLTHPFYQILRERACISPTSPSKFAPECATESGCPW